MGLRPLFGSRASVNNVQDSFGGVVEAAKSSETEHTNPLEDDQHSGASPPEESRVDSHSITTAGANQEHNQQHQQQGGHSLLGLLNGAALMQPEDDHSHPHHHDRDDSVESIDHQSRAEPANTVVPDQAAAWNKSANEAETSDQQDSSGVSFKLGRSLKKIDAKIRTVIGVNPPPTAEQMRSPYSIGENDHLANENNLGAVELLNDASLETLQHLSDGEDDGDDDDDVGDAEEDHDDVDDGDDRTVDGHGTAKPDKASIEKHLQELRSATNDAETRRSGSMDGARAGDCVRTKAPVKISSEEKMKALIEEFGECPSLSSPNEPEKLIIDLSCVLVKTVLIKGSVFLTNRRICFLAYIPNVDVNASSPSAVNKPASQNHADSSVRAPVDPNVQNPILKSGPAVIHRPGKMRAKRRVWIELRKTSFNAYAASNQLYKPLLSARLSNLHAVLPIDWAHPNIIRFVEGNKYSSVEFKTQEAALDWRNELEAAAFHARNTAEKVRISIPLERVVGMDSAPFLQVVNVIHIDVLVGSVKDADAAKSIKEAKVKAEYRHLVEQNWPTNHTFINCPKNPGFKCQITQVAIGFTHDRAAFIDLLREALKVPRSTHDPLGYQELLRNVPTPLLDFQGDADADEQHSDRHDDSAPDEQNQSLADKFCHAFGLPSRPEELHLVKAELVRTLHTHGTMAIGLNFLLFWRRAVGRDLRIKVPLTDIQGVDSYRSMLWHHHGLVVHIRAHSDMFFDFLNKENRDMVLSTLKGIVKAKEDQAKSPNAESHANRVESLANSTDSAHGTVKKSLFTQALLSNAEAEVPVFEPDVLAYVPKVVNVDRDVARDAIRISPMRIYCLTIGSRGDVQPYIALCKALKKHGHTPVIVSHPEYRGWVEGHDIEYRGVGGDPAALMKLSVEHRIFSPAFFRESIGKFRVWLDELLRECWEECQGADLLIESPSTMAGIHVAEGLGIPYFRAFTMPWTKTNAYPQAFSVPSIEMGPSYNSSSYALFDQIMWVATSGQINRWRKHMVGIGPTDLNKLDADNVPFIYNFSPAVVPMPNDWGDRVKISGYWFLDNPESNWKPPKEMLEFLVKAKDDGKKIAYIGFGSITIENAEEVSANIMKAVRESDVRAIVAKGWSGRGGSSKKKKKQQQLAKLKPALQQHHSSSTTHESEDNATESETEREPEIPSDVFVVDSVPHDWLFPQIDIAMHHGGAGTTGASLRAGLVTLIKPFFGDQFFWANRVAKLGAGARVNGLSVSDLTDALKAAASDRIMVEKAQGVGEKIRTEDGVATAIEFLYKNIPLAKRRTQRHIEREMSHASPAGTPSSSVFTNPLARFSSHSRSNSGSNTPRRDQHRSATLPPTGSSSAALSLGSEIDDGSRVLHKSTSTIVESPSNESSTDFTSSKSDHKSRKSSGSILPSLSSFSVLPSNMVASLKEMTTLQSNTSDTTADGEEARVGEKSATLTPTSSVVTGEEETEEHKLARLKGYKNAKAEDIRRRKLLLEKLERERVEKEEEKERKQRENKEG